MTEVIHSSMLPLVIKMSEDPVPNIRFNVAKTLGILAKNLDANTIQTKVKPTLTKLYEDADRDVKFYASQALSVLS